MKFNKDNFGWIFTTCALAILLGLSIYLGITGWYFKTEKSYTTDLELGKTVQFEIGKNKSNAISFNMDGSYLSGDRLPQIISIKNNEDSSLFLRAKIFIYTGDNQTLKMNMVENSNWTYQEEDDYYYFTDLLTSQNKVSLCSYIFIDENTHLQTNTKYIVTVLVESLDSSQNVVQIWGINPIQNI